MWEIIFSYITHILLWFKSSNVTVLRQKGVAANVDILLVLSYPMLELICNVIKTTP
jgi:hypothetical protein